jgi:sialate O-acetylesterase
LKRAIETYDPEKAKQQYAKQLEAYKKVVAKAKADGVATKARPPRHPVHPRLSPSSAARLYNGMIAPLAPYGLRGAIWYQGEADAGGAPRYGLQMRTMIADWRGAWQQGDFPFLFVQLPNFMALQQKPSETSGWPLIREQFLKTLSVPNTGMAVTIDIGDADDIHPKNKQDVGRRLAWWALAKVYKLGLPASGPLFRSAKKAGPAMFVEFDCCGALEARGGGPLKGFAIAGKDRKFVWAEARIQGAGVLVSSPEVREPEAVRYNWANNPNPLGNLVNQADLPASPFRTDDWPE